jgi:hypothetical protein
MHKTGLSKCHSGQITVSSNISENCDLTLNVFRGVVLRLYIRVYTKYFKNALHPVLQIFSLPG